MRSGCGRSENKSRLKALRPNLVPSDLSPKPTTRRQGSGARPVSAATGQRNATTTKLAALTQARSKVLTVISLVSFFILYPSPDRYFKVIYAQRYFLDAPPEALFSTRRSTAV